MSKKSKNQTRTAPARTVAAPQSTPVSSVSSARSFEREFNPDYSPVVKDLRRIGILAGSFFVILIALSFFLG